MRYDPENPPPPEVWKALDEDEARLMIARHHQSPRCAHPAAPNSRLHDLTHLLVETQAASSDSPIASTLERLVSEGLTRHEAVHAVGSVLSRYLFATLGPEPTTPDVDEYFAEVSALTAESWRQSARPDPEPHNPFLILGDDELIDLLFTEGDQLPRAAVDEIVARSSRLTNTLIATVIDPSTWAEPPPAWWATVHATFILAAIPDPACDVPLLAAMRDAEARGNDWITGAMPAILGAGGARLRPTLIAILGNHAEPPGVRCTAIDGLAASTLVDAEGREEVFARIGALFTTPTEDAGVREYAGSVLLDFQVRAYEQALRDFAAAAVDAVEHERTHGIPGLLAFDPTDVLVAFREPPDLSRYQESWLDFYDADRRAARRERWRREAAERRARRTIERVQPKVGRNDPCPCGSGRKYKKCCLRQ